MVLTSDNTVHMVHGRRSSGSVTEIQYVSGTAGAWTTAQLATNASWTASHIPNFNGVALDGDSKLHVCYYDRLNTDLR